MTLKKNTSLQSLFLLSKFLSNFPEFEKFMIMEPRKIESLLMYCFAFFFLLVNSCKDDVTGIRPIKAPGEYVWESDTLNEPSTIQNIMNSMWGSSSGNIFAVGHSDNSTAVMWHYNGTKWKDVGLHYVQGGLIKSSFTLASVFGFSVNDIWAVGQYTDYNPSPPPHF